MFQLAQASKQVALPQESLQELLLSIKQLLNSLNKLKYQVDSLQQHLNQAGGSNKEDSTSPPKSPVEHVSASETSSNMEQTTTKLDDETRKRLEEEEAMKVADQLDMIIQSKEKTDRQTQNRHHTPTDLKLDDLDENSIRNSISPVNTPQSIKTSPANTPTTTSNSANNSPSPNEFNGNKSNSSTNDRSPSLSQRDVPEKKEKKRFSFFGNKDTSIS